jgi:membrane fusion protein (multidrug efflux system)
MRVSTPSGCLEPEHKGEVAMNLERDDDQQRRPGRRFLTAWAVALLCVFGASTELVMARQTRIARQTSELEQSVARGPHVLVMQLSYGSPSRTIDLPASVHGYIETPVYAKVAGYMKAINVDKGDHVKAGQVIAIIESPETDKQVSDARSYYWLQVVTDRRNQELVHEEVIPQQTADYSYATMLQAKAAYEQELALQQYEVVRAPFDGIVTARYVDPGTLIPQSTTPSSTTTNFPIVAFATTAPLRVYAYVPQSLSPFIKDGDPANITVTEFPNRNYPGTVTRHPDALDQTTRTMLVEVDLPNQDRSLYPGMYAEMKMTARVTSASITVPDDALVFRDNKVYLPLVRGNHLKLVEVALGHDNGYEVEVMGDLRAGEMVAINVGQAARDGEPVQPVSASQGKS